MGEHYVGSNGALWGRSSLAEIMSGIRPYPWADKPRLVARSTAAYWQDRYTYVIRLHRTNILTFIHPTFASPTKGQPTKVASAGRIEVDCGGWMTPTTKDRINAWLLGFTLYSYKGEWAIRDSRDANWWNSQPFLGRTTIIDGSLPPLADWANPILCAEIDASITRFIKRLDAADWRTEVLSKTDLPWNTYNVRNWLTASRWGGGFQDYGGFAAKVLEDVGRQVGGKMFAARLGSTNPTVKAKLRRAVRDYLRREAGILPPAEDLKHISSST